MKHQSDNDGDELMDEINMIPMIDVSLVLLIIFMVMTPFLVRSQIEVDLPKASSAKSTPDKPQSVSVQITKAGLIYVDGTQIRSEELEDALHAKMGDSKTKALMIEADRQCPFDNVVKVLDYAKRSGISKLGVTVLKEQGGASARAEPEKADKPERTIKPRVKATPEKSKTKI